LIEKPMIDSDIEAAVGLGIEQTFEAEGFHGGWQLAGRKARSTSLQATAAILCCQLNG
jgi:hypothetical protein